MTAGYDGTILYDDGYATIRLGNGDGTFKTATSYTTEDNDSRAVALSDLNGDGLLDLITAGNNGSVGDTQGIATIRIGNGNGTFKAASLYKTESNESFALAVTDLNSDGVLDLITAGNQAGAGPGQCSIRLGNGDGSFQDVRNYTTDSYRSYDLALSDLNGDGLLDLVTAGDGSGFFGTTVRLGNGNGTFRAARSQVSEGWGSMALSLDDIDGDGLSDLVTVGDGTFGAGGPGWGTIRLGNGDGTFKTRYSYAADGYSSWALATGDVNGDGVADLVTAGQKTNTQGGATILLSRTREVTKMQSLNLSSAVHAREAMGVIDEVLTRVASERGALGAVQSRLAAAAGTLASAAENFSTAGSRVRDADVARESAELVRVQILEKAASAVLAQADRQPSIALQLLAP